MLISHQVIGEEIKTGYRYLICYCSGSLWRKRRLYLWGKPWVWGKHRLLFIYPISLGFISHLRVCWCAERREEASAAGGDKACCCGCGGGWSYLPVAEGAFSSLQAAALHCVPPQLCQHSPWAPQSQRASCMRTWGAYGHQLNVYALTQITTQSSKCGDMNSGMWWLWLHALVTVVCRKKKHSHVCYHATSQLFYV